ncbi:hypothetical protein ACFQY7_26470 [Actinomadura luteofluorescens]|uniref:hypothetical protein n=1 Tax=Actinomadura luteofluorescens TaxID=46163 RepID=UPI003645E789
MNRSRPEGARDGTVPPPPRRVRGPGRVGRDPAGRHHGGRSGERARARTVRDAGRLRLPRHRRHRVGGAGQGPLAASAGPHPAACDWLSYLRFRHKDGRLAAAADRILVAQPGILEGAGAFDSVARNTVSAAARSGGHIEFWALDRRSNCLEDGTGIQAGLRAKDVHLAVDYYYRQKEVDGRKFAGYQTNDQVKWLQNVGLEQTVRDQYDLMVRSSPTRPRAGGR